MAAPIPDGRRGAEPNDASFSFGAEAANAITGTITLLQGVTAIATRVAVHVYLSSDAAGATPVAAQTSLAVGGAGVLLGTLTAATSLLVLCHTDGTIQIVTTDTGVYSRYLNVILPNGVKVTSQAFTFA